MRSAKKFTNRGKLDEREIVFLSHYYGTDSPLKGNMAQSALAAGYSETTAMTKAPRILKKYGDASYSASAKAVGITKPYLAMRLKEILDLPVEDNAKEVMAAARLHLANMGESTDESGKGSNVNITGPTMVLVGATPDRIRALREAARVPTKEEIEEESNRRSAERLEQLRRGELPPIRRHSKAKGEEVIDVEATVIPDAPSGEELDQEAGSSEG